MAEVKPTESCIGKILAKPVICPKTQTLLLKAGVSLTNANIVTLKRREVETILIEENSTLFITPDDVIAIELKRELKSFIHLYTSDQIEANKTDKMYHMPMLLDGVIEEILIDPTVIELCVLMKITNQDLLFRHSIAVCAMSLLVAGAMDVETEALITIGKGALLHDIGLLEIPYLLAKESRTPQEELMWQEHVRYGYYVAMEKGVNAEVCALILSHHERWDGQGYPEGLSGKDIPIGARIITVCNVYDNLSRRTKLPCSEAIEFLYGSGGSYFDSTVITALCDNLAVYPLGALVQMSTGEVGVVINIRKNRGPRPIVRICFNRVNRSLTQPKDIDLAKELTMFIKRIY